MVSSTRILLSRRGPRTGSRRVAVLILCLTAGLVALGAPAAWAHGELERSDPPADAVLAAAPDQVRLWFNEPLDPTFSEVVVTDAGGMRVDAGDSGVNAEDTRVLQVGLVRRAPGVYQADWRVLSRIDGHLSSGVFRFTVGGLSRTAAPQSSGETPSATPVATLAKWLGLAAGFLLTGTGIFWVAVLRPLAARSPADQAGLVALARRVRWLQLIAAAGLLASLGMDPAARGLIAASGEAAVGSFLSAGYARAWLARAVVWMALAFLSWRPAPGAAGGLTVASLGSVAVGVGLLGSYSLTGHLASTRGVLGAFLDLVHLTGGAIWLGGIVALVTLAVSRPSQKAADRRRSGLPAIVARFSTLALGTVAVLLATGSAAAFLQLPSLASLVETAYGRALLLKLALFSALMTLGLLQLATVRYDVRALGALTKAAPWRRLQVLGRAEVVFGGLVLAAAAFLSLTPPRPGAAPPETIAQSPPAQPFHLSRVVDRFEATLDMDPRKFVSDRMVLTLTEEATGRTIDGATVRYEIYRTDRSGATTGGPALFRGNGRYEASGLPWSPGDWTVRFDVTLAGGRPFEVPFELELGPERSDFFLAAEAQPSDPEAERLLGDAAAAMRDLSSVRFDQTVDDGTGRNAVKLSVVLEAPDRSYTRIENGAETVQIGDQRYFRAGGGDWAVEQGPASEGVAGYWVWLARATSVRFAGADVWKGEHAIIVSFLVPDLPARFWEWIDADTKRIVREVMVADRHYMTTEFYGFDGPPVIAPPSLSARGPARRDDDVFARGAS